MKKLQNEKERGKGAALTCIHFLRQGFYHFHLIECLSLLLKFSRGIEDRNKSNFIQEKISQSGERGRGQREKGFSLESFSPKQSAADSTCKSGMFSFLL